MKQTSRGLPLDFTPTRVENIIGYANGHAFINVHVYGKDHLFRGSL